MSAVSVGCVVVRMLETMTFDLLVFSCLLVQSAFIYVFYDIDDDDEEDDGDVIIMMVIIMIMIMTMTTMLRRMMVM